ncbi:MAG: Asd/ArgC dimerization domain-containing protein [Myxococcaceae bacterium]
MTNKLAIVGATGLIGGQILDALSQDDFPGEDLSFFAGESSAGEEVEYDGSDFKVTRATPEALNGAKVVVLAAPADAARTLGPAAAANGAWVIDVSGAFRDDPKVPLVSPGVNDAVLAGLPSKMIAIASAPAQVVSAALEPLRQTFGLTEADVSLFLGASSAGNPGLKVLEQQTASLLNSRDPEISLFPHRLAFNLVPAVGAYERGRFASERALETECNRILGPSITFSALAVQAPIFHGLFAIIRARIERETSEVAAREVLKAGSGLKLLDAPNENVYPMPMLAAADEAVHVGRLRAAGKNLTLVAAADGALRTARLAVTLAKALARKD